MSAPLRPDLDQTLGQSSEKNLYGTAQKEFRDLAMRGNVIDLAAGVVIGTAFGKIIGSLVARLKELQRARFPINAIPTMAILGRSTGASEGNSVWPYLQGDHLVKAGQPSPGGEVIIPLAYKCGGGQRRTENDGH